MEAFPVRNDGAEAGKPGWITWVGLGALAMVLLFCIALWASRAEAQTLPGSACHNAMEIAKQLGAKYDEAPVAFGLQSNGNLLQVWSSAANGTWTIVSTTPAGISCIVAAGKRWESLPVASTDPLA
jgi:hypothetical protein